MNELERLRNGDTSLLVTLYKSRKTEFSKWVTKTFGVSNEDASEIFQSAVVTFYENVINDRLLDLKSSVKTYLFAIGKYKAMEFLRKKNKHQPLDLVQSDEENDFEGFVFESEDTEDQETRIQVISKSLSELGNPCSELITLFYYGKIPLAQLKEKLGYKTEESIKSQKFKCMERLRKIYFQYYRSSL